MEDGKLASSAIAILLPPFYFTSKFISMEAHFTHVLMTKDQGFLHFSFDCIISPHKKKYHVTVLKRGGENFHFLMEQKHGRWKIIEAPQPPRWVKGMEHQIEEMICEHQNLAE